MKSASLRELSSKLSSGLKPPSEQRVYLSMTKMSGHCNHNFNDLACFGQAVDKNIINKIHQLVTNGVTSVREVEKCIRYYVEDVLFAGKKVPSTKCRAFHPTKSDIANHIQAALREERASNVDQESAAALVLELEKGDPESRFFFRPHQKNEVQTSGNPTDSDDMEESVANEYMETLLFCYQSKFMGEIMAKYGSNLALIDATNKTTDYALPLFFIVVKTSIGYMIAGIFIVQFETSPCASKHLQCFKSGVPISY